MSSVDRIELDRQVVEQEIGRQRAIGLDATDPCRADDDSIELHVG